MLIYIQDFIACEKKFKKVLTRILVICYYLDKESCQIENFSCHKALYDLIEEVNFMPLYNRLKEYRAKIGVNQQEMGRLVGVSRQTISQIERGDYSPSVTLALKIAKVFCVKVEDIFEYSEEDNNE